MKPIILDFDHSVKSLEGEIRLPLSDYQKTIRFAASMRNYKKLGAYLEDQLGDHQGPVFLGSGDYHHISHLLIARQTKLLGDKRLTVVILDNHPDNMRYPFGIHCGSWVSYTAALPFVDHVHVLGITSNDIGLSHAVENRLNPLIRGKLTYWSTGVDVGWAKYLGLKNCFMSFKNIDDLVSAFISAQICQNQSIYLSIDKDVLSKATIKTNWDQGQMEMRHLQDLVVALSPCIRACDITGEVSDYQYKTLGKRLMSKLDGQNPVPINELDSWQEEHRIFNQMLLGLFARFCPISSSLSR
ncbi:hypothetical protein [Bartonella sp. HY038]|uniref:hypothetical protein n=1 Tax=Bartonella sp. HY038 TaxID=2759660 RepID=UPI0015F9EE77|nr:hypothetical protein [Bartonella sp. HY038]